MRTQIPLPTLRRGRRRKYALIAAIVTAMTAVVSWTVAGPLRLVGADEAPLSQGKPATASSTEGGNWSAAAAVDGDTSTRWSSAFSDPQWLMVDLGGQATIERVVLRWEAAYAKAFQVQVSPDGATWTSLYDTATGTGGTQSLAVAGQGRYVRMYGTTRATGYGFSLWEFQVFGTRGTDANPGTPASATVPGVPPASSVPPVPGPSASNGGQAPGGQPGYVLADPPVTGVVPSRATPPNKEHREFQANCAVSHRLPDDPIVFPGLPGASHDHTFMGNTTTNAASTTTSLLAGSTLCRVPGDRSGYWMPTLYNGDTAVLPVGPQVIYYKSGVRDYTSVRPFPVGLRYLVGSPKTTAEQFKSSPAYQKGWECGASYENVDFPANCPAGTQLNLRMQAPGCWDGRHLDTPDHISHMAYPSGGVCPTTHPVAVPMIEFKMAFPVSGDMSKVRLSSGRGYTFHYDFYNAWDMPTLTALVKQCINAGRQCDARGFDQFEPGAGAALDELYQLPGSRTALDRTGWTATASRSGDTDSPARMLDGNTGTRWTSGAPMTNGMSVTVDMKKSQPVGQVSLLATGADHPRGFEIYLSADGANWTGPVARGAGLAELTTVSFPRQDARYIRVVQTGSSSSWWSVAEFAAYSG
ncbi:DUF1996 domain-containing protein [Dactylosporangium sp. NPDC050688]|uniref:DUF1996 domain-containing protein n=1 Tax=Dactylosporangium sp. NPDC050688 TaxID=3157217 RepID=UPI0033C3DF67